LVLTSITRRSAHPTKHNAREKVLDSAEGTQATSQLDEKAKVKCLVEAIRSMRRELPTHRHGETCLVCATIGSYWTGPQLSWSFSSKNGGRVHWTVWTATNDGRHSMRTRGGDKFRNVDLRSARISEAGLDLKIAWRGPRRGACDAISSRSRPSLFLHDISDFLIQ